MRVLFLLTWATLNRAFKIINVIVSGALLKTTAAGESRRLFGFVEQSSRLLISLRSSESLDKYSVRFHFAHTEAVIVFHLKTL